MKTLFLLLAMLFCFSAYAATDARRAAWTAEVDGDELQLTIFAPEGEVVPLSTPFTILQGLSKADAASDAAVVRFELRRPAGTLTFDGRFADGTGAGEFRFTPSEPFVHEMATRGYSGFSEQELLMLALRG